MAVDMQDVRRVLDPEEPDYGAAAALGPDALPHLRRLVREDDPLLASKATYAASLLEGNQGQEVIAAAGQHSDPAVRVAAAAAARNLPPADASDVLLSLVGDDDPGVRKVARASVPNEASGPLAERMAAQAGAADDAGDPPPSLDPSLIDALMPGEDRARSRGGLMAGGQPDGLMPGEVRQGQAGDPAASTSAGGTGSMPGEQRRPGGPPSGLMPGERG